MRSRRYQKPLQTKKKPKGDYFPYPNPHKTVGHPHFRATLNKLAIIAYETRQYEKQLHSNYRQKRQDQVPRHISKVIERTSDEMYRISNSSIKSSPKLKSAKRLLPKRAPIKSSSAISTNRVKSSMKQNTKLKRSANESLRISLCSVTSSSHVIKLVGCSRKNNKSADHKNLNVSQTKKRTASVRTSAPLGRPASQMSTLKCFKLPTSKKFTKKNNPRSSSSKQDDYANFSTKHAKKLSDKSINITVGNDSALSTRQASTSRVRKSTTRTKKISSSTTDLPTSNKPGDSGLVKKLNAKGTKDIKVSPHLGQSKSCASAYKKSAAKDITPKKHRSYSSKSCYVCYKPTRKTKTKRAISSVQPHTSSIERKANNTYIDESTLHDPSKTKEVISGTQMTNNIIKPAKKSASRLQKSSMTPTQTSKTSTCEVDDVELETSASKEKGQQRSTIVPVSKNKSVFVKVLESPEKIEPNILSSSREPTSTSNGIEPEFNKSETEVQDISVRSPEIQFSAKSNIKDKSLKITEDKCISLEKQKLAPLESNADEQCQKYSSNEERSLPKNSDEGLRNTSIGRYLVKCNERKSVQMSVMSPTHQDNRAHHKLSATDTSCEPELCQGPLTAPCSSHSSNSSRKFRLVPTIINADGTVSTVVKNTLPSVTSLPPMSAIATFSGDTSSSLTLSGYSFSSIEERNHSSQKCDNMLTMKSPTPAPPTSPCDEHKLPKESGNKGAITKSPTQLQNLESDSDFSDCSYESSELSEVSPSEFFTEHTLAALKRITRMPDSKILAEARKGSKGLVAKAGMSAKTRCKSK